jgi:hypothetical protein
MGTQRPESGPSWPLVPWGANDVRRGVGTAAGFAWSGTDGRGDAIWRRSPDPLRYAPRMLWTVVVILLLLWFLGLLLRAFGGLIHLLLIAALVVVIYRLLTGRKIL